jgi:PAS domain S-box-containing protein
LPPAQPDFDLTRRKKPATQRGRSAAIHRSVYENAIEGIFRSTPEGRYLSANPALAQMLGYNSPEELIASVKDIGRQLCVDPASRSEMKRRLEQDGYIRAFENQIYRKDGTIIWTSINARAVTDSQGTILYYEGTSQDITERKETQLQLATLYHAIESTAEMICITNLQDQFTFVNRAFELAYGYSRAEILGKSPGILYSPRNPPGLLAEILEQTRRGGWRGEVLDRRKDGSEFPIELATSQVKDHQGHVIGLMGIAQDISQRKQAEEALRQAQARLQAHAQELEQTVAQRTAKLREIIDELHHVSYAMIHDMRAPLRAMRGFADLLGEACDKQEPQRIRDYNRRIRVAAARLDNLIIDALNYTRVLHEQLPMRPVDLGALVHGLVETYPNLHPDLADISILQPLPVVLGNDSLLTQCFSNLLGNAAKFTAPGVKPTIRVWAEPANSSPNSCRVWVEDNGIGIPAEVRPRLFGIFEKFHDNYEGTGIGLAIVRKVTERMGGAVGVESELGKGSRFWVELPCPPL